MCVYVCVCINIYLMKKKLYETIGIWEGLKKEAKVVMNAITFQFNMYFVVTDFLSQQPVPK